jgi:hypothetical protein
VSRRQAGRWAAQEQQQTEHAAYEQQQYAPPPPPPPSAGSGTDDMIEQLQKLAELRDQGILTPTEFEVQKAKLLAG